METKTRVKLRHILFVLSLIAIVFAEGAISIFLQIIFISTGFTLLFLYICFYDEDKTDEEHENEEA